MKRLVLAVLLALGSVTTAYAGAWLQDPGHGQLITQATYFDNSHYFDTNGIRQPQARFTKYEFQPYIEYGLLPNLTIGGTAYAQQNHQSDSQKTGIADPEIFARTRLWYDDRQVISIQPLIKLPSLYRSNASPRGGSDSTNLELSLLYGRNLPILSNRDYLDLRAGYRMRSGELRNQWRADAAFGFHLGERWQIIPAVRAVIATEIPQNVTFSETGDLDHDLLKAELSTVYQLNDKQRLHLGVFSHVAGRQAGNGYGISAGVTHAF